MLQQVIAIVVVAYFLFRLIWQKKKMKISKIEFVFWFLFWSFSLLAVIGIRYIDSFVARLGFSAAGVDVIVYFGVLILFYMVFRIRLRQERIDREITKISRTIAIDNAIKSDKKQD